MKKRLCLCGNEITQITGLNRGGMEKWIMDIAHRMSEKYDVTVVSCGSNWRTEKIGKIKVYYIPRPITHEAVAFTEKPLEIKNFLPYNIKVYMFYSRMADLIEKINPDVVHVNQKAFPVHKIRKKLPEAFIIISYHNEWGVTNCFWLPRIFWTHFSRLWVYEADRVLAPSRFIKEDIDKHLGTHNSIVVPYGVDIQKYVPIQKKQDSNSIKVFFAGRITWCKGLHILFDALEGIDENYSLNVAGPIWRGEADYFKRIKKQAAHLNVRFLGALSERELIPQYQMADIHIVPSMELMAASEASGIVNMEAMACGTPVIGSNVGGIPEIIQQGKTGLLVNPDAESLRTALLRLMKDEQLRLDMGKSARELALRKFSLERVVTDLEDVYEGNR